MYRLNLSSSFAFKHGTRAEIFGFFNSPRRTLQGSNPSFSMFHFGIKKELFKKRGSIGISIVEPFNKWKSFNTELEGSNFYQRSEFKIPFRSIGINFNYRFGKLDFKQPRPKQSKIKNTDLKQGEGGEEY